MMILDANAVAAALPYDRLIDRLDRAFAADITVPERTHLEVPVPGGSQATLLLMPAWQRGTWLGVKLATVFPDNAQRGLPAVHASYLLMDARTGEPVALLDGTELTLRRTAAASALASRYLSRADAARLLMVGTGNLAPHLVAAHASARPLTSVTIWGRRRDAAEALAVRLSGHAFSVATCADLQDAVRNADIISCATLATNPLIRGAWLRPGQHLDLVGAFRPDMREADAEAVRRASVYVDTREGAFKEAGELVQAIAGGVITAADIRGTLRDLVTGVVAGRQDAAEITAFKSVGTALEDLAAAELAMAIARSDDG